MIALEGCYVATADTAGYRIRERPPRRSTAGRITAVGAGPAPDLPYAERIDGRGLLVTPGLVNVHHHLYQWITRGYAIDGTLFELADHALPGAGRGSTRTSCTTRPPRTSPGWRSPGTTTSTDHHYVFPTGAGDLLEAEITAAQRVGLRFHPTRGSMNLGASQGGLPPDAVVEDHDAILSATEDAIARWHDPAPEAMVRIAGRCSPFSVTAELMRDSAALARRAGVRHAHAPQQYRV